MNIRKIDINDYEKYLNLLSQLTDIGQISEKEFTNRINIINSNHYLDIYVIEDSKTKELIGSGTLYIEPKIIHSCSFLGHIEDIVIDKKYRGKNYGKYIIDHLVRVAKLNNCYKLVLTCNQKNIGFYDKCGFKIKDYNMICRL